MLRMNIAFAGLTAAGKTTHAKILAAQLGYVYVSATEVLLDVLGMSNVRPERVWFTELGAINAMRDGDQVDDELERRLRKIATENDGLVLDTWALPWLTNIPMIRMWVESDRLSRSWKCFVSQGNDPRLSLIEAASLVDEKDQTTRQIFLRRHNFDLFEDRDVFDVIVDNSWLISEPTRSAADQGIKQFASVIHTLIAALLKASTHDFSDIACGWNVAQIESVKRFDVKARRS